MDREAITGRVASTEVVALAFLAAQRPDDLFGATFFDIREKARDVKSKWEEEARNRLQETLAEDLKGKGFSVISLQISLGKYRGSRFVTSAKLRVAVKTGKEAERLLEHLRTKYSPKYQLKSFEDGEAEYNVR